MMGWPFMAVAGLLWMLAAVLVAAGVVILIVAAIGRSSSSSDDAINTLRARFARGDIDADEFARARDTLGSGPSRRPGSRGLVLGLVVLVIGLLLGALGWASLAGFGGMMSSEMMGMMGPGPTAPAGTSVTLAGARFAPATLSIRVGETVRWFNDDSMPHTVTAADRSWDSANLAPGGSFERRFDAAGTYPYVCLYHASMTAVVEVRGP